MKKVAMMTTHSNIVTFVRNIGNAWVEYNRQLLVDKVFEDESDEVFTILDVGCGEGPFSNRILQRFIRCNLLVGIDISIEAIAKAKQTSTDARAEYIVADAQFLPFKNATFDLTFSKDLLHHVDKQVSVLKEIKRVCNNNIIIVEANRPNLIMLLYTKFGHKHFTLDQLKSLVKKADLKLERLKQLHAYPITCHFPPKNLMIILWDVMMSLLLFASNLFSDLPKAFLRVFSRFMNPSFNVLHIK